MGRRRGGGVQVSEGLHLVLLDLDQVSIVGCELEG
jgi:hypothetical protein